MLPFQVGGLEASAFAARLSQRKDGAGDPVSEEAHLGFGPRARDGDGARKAISDLILLLYPEHATPAALAALDRLSALLLESGAPLSFRSMDRLLRDPAWREQLLDRAPDSRPAFAWAAGVPILPSELDPDFAWLLQDRLAAAGDEEEPGPTDR